MLKLDYYLFENPNSNNRYWWIPLKDNQIYVNSGTSRLEIYYNRSKNDKINHSNYEAIYIQNVKLESDGSITFNDQTLQAVVDEKLVKDRKKLNEIKKILDNNILLVANLRTKFATEFNKIFQEESGLIHQFSWCMEKANATIEDKVFASVEENNNLWDEVVSKII